MWSIATGRPCESRSGATSHVVAHQVDHRARISSGSTDAGGSVLSPEAAAMTEPIRKRYRRARRTTAAPMPIKSACEYVGTYLGRITPKPETDLLSLPQCPSLTVYLTTAV